MSIARDLARSIGASVRANTITASGTVSAGGVDSSAVNDLIDLSLINASVADFVGADGGYGQVLTSLGNDTTEWSNLNLPNHTINSNSRVGTIGDVSFDGSYFYICTAADTWKRIAFTDSSW